MEQDTCLPRWFTLWALWLGLTSACVPAFDDDQSAITSRRILAVRATPAEAARGQDVNLSALISAPLGDDTAGDRLEWSLCLARKPLTELGPVAQVCVDEFFAGGELLQPLGMGQDVSGTVPSEACRLFGPLQPAASADGIAARPVDPDRTGGYYQPVILGDTDVALASIRLSCGVVGLPSTELIRYNQGYRPNENPEVESLELTLDGATRVVLPGVSSTGATVPAGARVELRVLWPACPRDPVCGDGLCTAGENQVVCAEDCRDDPRGCAGAEDYLWADAETRTVRTRREGVIASWFVTSGRLAEERTGRTEHELDGVDATNTWTVPSTPGRVGLWVVLRDDRGGVGWGEYLIDVE